MKRTHLRLVREGDLPRIRPVLRGREPQVPADPTRALTYELDPQEQVPAVPGVPTEHAADCGCKRCTETCLVADIDVRLS